MDSICFRCVEEGTIEAAPESGCDALRLCLRHALHLLEELRLRFNTAPTRASIDSL